VKIIKAVGLPQMDVGAFKTGKADPFCVVYDKSNKENSYRTKVCNQTLNPIWDEELIMTNLKDEKLGIEVYDQDILTGNDFIG